MSGLTFVEHRRIFLDTGGRSLRSNVETREAWRNYLLAEDCPPEILEYAVSVYDNEAWRAADF
jgi:hypothetical protein